MRWWSGHDVLSCSHGAKHYRHPQLGEVTVHCEARTLLRRVPLGNRRHRLRVAHGERLDALRLREPQTADAALARRLWETSAEMVGL